MADVPTAVQELLNAMNREFAQQLPGKIRLVEKLWKVLLKKYNYEDFMTLHLCVHSLAGSSASFGNAPVGNAARVLEQYLDKFLDAHEPGLNPFNAAQRAQISSYVESLKTLVAEAEHLVAN